MASNRDGPAVCLVKSAAWAFYDQVPRITWPTATLRARSGKGVVQLPGSEWRKIREQSGRFPVTPRASAAS
jgi:hypothetical protein